MKSKNKNRMVKVRRFCPSETLKKKSSLMMPVEEESVGLVVGATSVSVQNFLAIHPVHVKVIQSGMGIHGALPLNTTNKQTNFESQQEV